MKTTTRSAIVRKAALASCEENDGMDIAFVNELFAIAASCNEELARSYMVWSLQL